MELSKVERWLLASKFEELAKDESFTNQERKDYKKYAKVLWSGYKREYKQALDFLGLPDPLPNEKC